jgi:metal-responsive CopG/Arc/MetJ family transcriptional regulator
MRTTVKLDDDVAAVVNRMREERGIGLSEAVNDLARAGISNRGDRPRFKQKTYDMGVMIDVSNVQDAIEFLEGIDHR